jgi:pimeloyl-ACP methyl ester carboxylesterase
MQWRQPALRTEKRKNSCHEQQNPRPDRMGHRKPNDPATREKESMNIKTAIITTLAAAMGLAASAPAPTSLAAPAPPVPVLHWAPCHGGFQCATARVPLDYRHPGGAKISIAVIRHLATDPAHRLGSLFINGGGPGPQVDGLVSTYQAIPAALRASYDIITFDPRGFGASTPIQCFPTFAAENALLARLPATSSYPQSAHQISVSERIWAAFDTHCARNAGHLLYHDSTADVARDMNLLRQAVGDPMLNYVGLSYGTGLGATYANLFPATTGHMALDGNLNPVAWTRQYGRLPTWLRTGQDLATATVLRDFLDLCGKTSRAACAFSARTPAATRAKFTTLLARLHQHPVTIGTPPQTYNAIAAANSVPVDSVSQWQDGAKLLQQLWGASSATGGTAAGTVAAAARTGHTSAAAAPAARYVGPEQELANLCADSPNPRDGRAYPAAAKLALARSGLVGPLLAWQTEPCAAWPAAAAQDRYAGPWNRPTTSTILVLGNTGDPTTSYHSSVAMSRDLARARLLTIRGYGHTEYENPSTCATNYEVSYLLTGNLPPIGTVCPQNAVPFPSAAAK